MARKKQAKAAETDVAKERIEEARRDGEIVLDLMGLNLTEVPASLGSLANLQVLSLANNQLTSVPASLGSLANLKVLYLANNQLTSVPASLGSLANLQVLSLANNQLTSVPASLGSLANLKVLSLYSNQLTSVPASLGSLANLQVLSLHTNRLSSLPESLGSFANLQELSLHTNRLSSLPESLGSFANLRELYLANNQLTSLPESLGSLANLRTLDLFGNPLNPELAAARAQGIDAVKAYLRAQAQARIVLNEGKLILVGEGEVGKSCLLDALRGQPWRERPSTHGIEVHPVSVSAPDGTRITLNGWDFGGQKVYKPTHQLFFSAPAVYLVVWKPREGSQQGMVREWIKLVLHREPGAKILVVATHGGPSERLPDISPQELRDQFGRDKVLGFFHVDSKPDGAKVRRGIDALKAEIGKVAASIPEVSRTVPTKWQNAREALRKQKDAYLPYQEFARVCREDHGMDDEQTALFGRISHELGDLIHYHTDSALKEVVVLKPNWLAKAISFILADPTTRDRNGLADRAHLCQIWAKPPIEGETGYPAEVHPVFLKLMEKFDLSYPVVFSNQPSTTSLIAQLVQDDRPASFPGWDDKPGDGDAEQRQVCRIVDDKGQSAMAEGLFYQLIVRLHKFSLGRDDYKQSVHWQRGLMLDGDYNGRALLEHLSNDVRITVRAAYPAQFLGYLTTEVKSLVEAFWKGMRCEVTVPCVHPCGKSQPGLGLFEVEKLVASVRKKRPEYPCSVPGCEQWQNIDSLLQNAPSPVADARRELLDQFDVVNRTLTVIRKHQKAYADRGEQWFEQLDDGQKAILSRIDEQFDGLMQALTDEAKDGPRLFSFEAVEPGFWSLGKWMKQEFRLTLWCEHTRLPMPVIARDKEAGVYQLSLPREWVTKAAPYLKFLSTTLSMVLPVAASATKLALDETAYKQIEKQLDFGNKCADAFLKGGKEIGSALLEGDDMPDWDPAGRVTHAHGPVLRELHAFLKEKDPGFGGLVRVQNKRREFLWVHPKFADQY